MQKRFKLAFLGLTLAFVLVGCFDMSYRNHIMLNAPDGLKSKFDPRTKSLSLASNEAFVLFFFDTDCGACKAQIPVINELAKKYEDRVKFIGVLGGSKGFDKDIELLKQHGIKFATTSDPISVEYFSSAVGGIYGVPATFIFNAKGQNAAKLIGVLPLSAIENKLKVAL